MSTSEHFLQPINSEIVRTYICCTFSYLYVHVINNFLLLRKYADRLTYTNVQSVWSRDSGLGLARNFNVNVTVLVPPSRIRYIRWIYIYSSQRLTNLNYYRYVPGVAETLKFGWIQYVSFFLIIKYLVG